MSHPFFANIDWQSLIDKRPTGNYVAQPPKYSIDDYLQVLTSSEFTDEEIDDIFNGIDYSSSDEEEDVSSNEEEHSYHKKVKEEKKHESYVYTTVPDWEYDRDTMKLTKTTVGRIDDPIDEEVENRVDEEKSEFEGSPVK